MKFKTTRLRDEWDELFQQNPKLHYALTVLDGYCTLEFNQEVTITHLFRTKEEHNELYAQTVPEKRPGSSPHMYWKAADIRSRDFDDHSKYKMLRFLQCWTYSSGQGRRAALLHTIAGNTEHFHIQID